MQDQSRDPSRSRGGTDRLYFDIATDVMGSSETEPPATPGVESRIQQFVQEGRSSLGDLVLTRVCFTSGEGTALYSLCGCGKTIEVKWQAYLLADPDPFLCEDCRRGH
jgi:hypothetical protein